MLPNSSTATLRRKAMPYSRTPIRSPVFAFPPPPLAALAMTHRFLNSYSLTFNALSNTSSAFGPRIVT